MDLEEIKDMIPVALNDFLHSGFGDDSKVRIIVMEAFAAGEQSGIAKALEVAGTHEEGEDLGYCDTGADMENACRSECVEMAIQRIAKLKNL